MWLVVVFGLIDLHLLSVVQNTHRSSVVYYWTISSSSFRSPKALRDDKTWSLHNFFFFFLIFFKFYFIFKLYIFVLVLPNIRMNPPQVYMCSPSWSLLPPHTIPLGRPSAPAPSIQYRASNLDCQLISYMIFYMFQCHSPKSSHPLPLPQSP